jgi:hypothetical protein
MPEFSTPEELAAYWQGRHEEAADALQHEHSQIDRILLAAVKWVEPSQVSERDG